ncbi:hypothetical protein like AT5G35450 [Hibiscus trionum]|uniref:NB-ARC domain-containing protein n=1 Tax=Hibiscus trionum TaxID=183268 RepID=A0A9W7GTE0_HIBTR|nr:hypothetical protein like AT5G35450 [Hibiscus trionum]
MAFETAQILISKLNLVASQEPKFRGLKTDVIRNSIEELKHLQKILEAADEIDEEWDELLKNIFSLEDDIETLLGRTMASSRKVQRKRRVSSSFLSERSLSNTIDQLTESIRDYCNKIQPSPSSDCEVPAVESIIPPTESSTESEDLQVSTDNETITSNASMIVLPDLEKKLSQQVLSRLTLQYLLLTVDGTYLGKAILLWTVYSADDIKGHFQCRAWVRVSEEVGQREISLDILKQITGSKEEERLPLRSPQRSLHDFLVSKRYLIVLYGVRTAEFLDSIKAAFPYSLNGSKVITVVENENVARQISSWISQRHDFSDLKKMKGQLLDRCPQSSTYLEDEYGITGVKAEIDKLTKSILNQHSLLFLISIKGTVGSGKTTLLWPIYNGKDVKRHFQCRAWVDIPKEYHEIDVLTDIFEQVTSVKLKETVELLRKRLHNFLAQKRYLVVLCNLWTSKIWDNLKLSLPNSLNGSRVIFTLSEGEANSEMTRKSPNLKDVREGFSDPTVVEHRSRLSDGMAEESSIVGFIDKEMELEELTLNSYKLHFLISVLGVAGSGKSTLAWKIYNSVASKRHFTCRAWVNVPPKLDDFHEKQLLVELLGQLRNATQKESLTLEQLRERLHLFLTWKRFLIILDDVPTPDVWERLNRVFPNLSNGSRVIITTRNAYLAYHINPETVVLQLRPLTDGESWELFLKKVQASKKMEIDENDSELTDLKEKILQRCHGLPLLIVLLGGLLSRKDPYDEWSWVIDRSIRKMGKKKKKLQNEATSGEDQSNSSHKLSIDKMEKQKKVSTEDRMNPSDKSASSNAKEKNEKKEMVMEPTTASRDEKDFPILFKQKEEKMKLRTEATYGEDQSNYSDKLVGSDEMALSDIMALAYQDLAPDLRCCLLYLGLFPKSYEIPLRRLHHLWLAEGFVTTTDQEKPVEEYFEELKCRNMIEVTKLKSNGSPKACRVPNTIYDTLFLDTEKVGFLHFSSSSGICGSPWFNIRRLSENSGISCQSENIKTRVQQLRSYISFYGKRGDAPTYGVKELLSKVVEEDFRMLVVLDLEGVYKPVLSDTLGKLPYIKYLGLRRTLLDDLPQSVGDLHHLETLDIKHTFITELPSTIWEAKKLQHLYMSEIDVDLSTLKSSASGSLNKLKILWGVVIKSGSPEKNWMESLVDLRKLKITCNEASNKVTGPWITQMKKLQSLKLRLLDKFNKPLDFKLRVEDMQTWKQMSLSQLYLLGKLPDQVPTIDFPEKLEVLTLSMTHMSKDQLKKLGELQQLKVLRLYAQSFLGREMTCDRGGFPQLKVLKLWMLYKLNCWTVEEGSMPMLREVEIRSCKNLKKLDGLEKLAALKELTLTNMTEDFVANVEKSMGSSSVAIMKNFYFSPLWEQ